MKKTSNICKIMAAVITASCLTACNATTSKTIPAVNEATISEAANTLGVSTEDLEMYFENLDTTFDDYIETLNNNNTTLETLKENIEKNYDCTFKNYIDTVITVNNKTIPDDSFSVFKSKYSVFDAYIPTAEIKDNTLVNYNVSFVIADEADDTMAFDIMQTYSGDFRRYLDYMNSTYGCKSVEFTNMSIFGGYGATRPDEDNPCMDRLFVYDDKTNEILEQITVSVLTMHFDNTDKNITLALSNELGLLFKTTGADSEKKMLKLSNLKFQVRKASHV